MTELTELSYDDMLSASTQANLDAAHGPIIPAVDPRDSEIALLRDKLHDYQIQVTDLQNKLNMMETTQSKLGMLLYEMIKPHLTEAPDIDVIVQEVIEHQQFNHDIDSKMQSAITNFEDSRELTNAIEEVINNTAFEITVRS